MDLTDWKELCERLVEVLELCPPPRGWETAQPDLIASARAALVEPVVAPAWPTSQQLKTFACVWWKNFGFTKDKATCTWVIDEITPEHFVDFSWDLLARYGHQPLPPAAGADCPACEGVPKPGNQPCAVCGRSASSAEGEVADEARYLARELHDQADDMSPALELFGLMHRAADLLEQRHPAPVPVSERLPGPEDCDAEGKVWGTAELGGWTRVHHSKISRWRAWLPAHALPLPSGEVE